MSDFNFPKDRLINLLPLRIVLKRTPEGIEGLTEESFSMGWEKNRVNIFWSGKAYSMLGEHVLDAEKDATHHRKPGEEVWDPTDENCPVSINWTRWINATNKYDKRNAPFEPKGQKEMFGA